MLRLLGGNWKIKQIEPNINVGLNRIGAVMMSGTLQIANGGWHKIRHTILPWPLFNNSGRKNKKV